MRAALVALAALAACTAGPVNEAPPTAHPKPAPSAPVPVPVPVPEKAPPPTEPAPQPQPAKHEGPLAHFYDALAELESHTRNDHLRILWLGDSHAQADFWPDALRRALQTRFGNGGPGFLHVGMDAYRHAGVHFELEGSWRMRPKKPSTTLAWSDGAFGLGGILNAGWQGKRIATVELTDERLAGKKLVYDLCYKPGTADDKFTFELRAPTGPTTETFPEGAPQLGVLEHHVLHGDALQLALSPSAGRPDFCGLVIETDPADGAGVVLDNLGINGARYATALAWNEASWATEVRRRQPELFIFEYGGNEASDVASNTAHYEKTALDLIARAQRIRPEASCLVVGPSDRVDAEDRIPPIVDVLREAATLRGCAFFDTWAVMGGKGSLRIWRDADKAADDGIHLKPKGYAELGALFVAEVMAGYHAPPQAGVAASTP
jgi:lysophospholipase L1-like esterase